MRRPSPAPVGSRGSHIAPSFPSLNARPAPTSAPVGSRPLSATSGPPPPASTASASSSSSARMSAVTVMDLSTLSSGGHLSGANSLYRVRSSGGVAEISSRPLSVQSGLSRPKSASAARSNGSMQSMQSVPVSMSDSNAGNTLAGNLGTLNSSSNSQYRGGVEVGRSRSNSDRQEKSSSSSIVEDVKDASSASSTTSTLILYRPAEERMMNPERLNVDRRNLTSCPVLHGEERLKLLNFQNNRISEISNLNNLPNLIFLDLYNNRITHITNLGIVPTLRVLMLGKNRIEKIEGLESLRRLDVLDLHSNRITVIENISHLHDLRVLNLAGNLITDVRGISGLQSLSELNLRRNQISCINEIDKLPSLQRLFLSSNQIESIQKMNCVFRCSTLVELSLDNNPIADTPAYRSLIISRFPSLLHLDLQKISHEERLLANSVVNSTSHLSVHEAVTPVPPSTNHSLSFPPNECDDHGLTSCLSLPTSSPSIEHSQEPVLVRSDRALEEQEAWRNEMKTEAVRNRRVLSSVDHLPRDFENESLLSPVSSSLSVSSASLQSSHHREGSSASLEMNSVDSREFPSTDSVVLSLEKSLAEDCFVSFDEGIGHLHIKGNSATPSGKLLSSGQLLSVTMECISITRIRENWLPLLRSHSKLLTQMTLRYNKISRLVEFDSFSFLSPHLVMLLVEHQPVLDRATSLFRPFVISKFPRLLTLNGQHVSSGDRNISDQFFGSFSRFRFEHPSAWDNDVREIPPPFQSKGSDFSRSQDPSHYSEMTSNYILPILDHALTVERKIRSLNSVWDEAVDDMIVDALLEHCANESQIRALIDHQHRNIRISSFEVDATRSRCLSMNDNLSPLAMDRLASFYHFVVQQMQQEQRAFERNRNATVENIITSLGSLWERKKN